MSRNIISDGYTRKGRIAEQKNWHGELTFSFRPMLAEDTEKLDDTLAKATAAQQIRLLAKMLSEQIVSWSEVDEKGNAVPVTMESCRRLPRPIFLKAASMVRLMTAGDDLPQDDTEATAEIERLLEGPGRLEEALRGN